MCTPWRAVSRSASCGTGCEPGAGQLAQSKHSQSSSQSPAHHIDVVEAELLHRLLAARRLVLDGVHVVRDVLDEHLVAVARCAHALAVQPGLEQRALRWAHQPVERRLARARGQESQSSMSTRHANARCSWCSSPSSSRGLAACPDRCQARALASRRAPGRPTGASSPQYFSCAQHQDARYARGASGSIRAARRIEVPKCSNSTIL